MTNLLYPKTLDFSCDFSVIHETPLGWSEDGLWEVVDITPDTGDGAGSRDFDYEKNSFPFMSWKESVNDVFNLKTPAEETDDYESAANASMPTQEEADIANPVPDASADIRAQEEQRYQIKKPMKKRLLKKKQMHRIQFRNRIMFLNRMRNHSSALSPRNTNYV